MINNNKEAFLIAFDLLLSAPTEDDFNNVKGLMRELIGKMSDDEINACHMQLIENS